MIQWKEQFILGVGEVDEQHKKLFQIANAIYDLLKNDLITDKYDKIVGLINELREYTIFHFSSEEEYMRSIKYRKYLSHKVAHDDFIEKISSLDMDMVDLDHEQYLIDLLDFIVDWISTHILETDKAYTA